MKPNFKKTNLTVLCAGLLTLLASSPSNVNAVSVTVATAPPGLSVTVDGINYVAPAVFDWTSGSPHTLAAPSPQPAPDGHSRNVFSSWSVGGSQTNQITTPDTDTTYTAAFTDQYLLDLAVTPATAGTVSNNPAGPWYNAGQTVSLTAATNANYQFLFWVGAVDSQTGNTAQITMTGYHTVTAA